MYIHSTVQSNRNTSNTAHRTMRGKKSNQNKREERKKNTHAHETAPLPPTPGLSHFCFSPVTHRDQKEVTSVNIHQRKWQKTDRETKRVPGCCFMTNRHPQKTASFFSLSLFIAGGCGGDVC